jgi:uncharacterized small protein (DUF1192 family)
VQKWIPALATAVTVASFGVVLNAGQSAAPAKPATPASAKAKPAAAKKWVHPRTPWGDPDIQGIWNNGTITPLERPNGIDKDLLSEEETEQADHGEAVRAVNRPEDRVRDLELAYNQEWWDRGKSIGRTSLVTEPDGRIPALTEEGKRRRAAYDKDRASRGPADSVYDRPMHERCLLYRSTPPLPTGYNNNYRIFQTPGLIAILQEQIHDTRFIYMDGRPHIPDSIKRWTGDSRGRWEGETLVVETTNYDKHIDFFKFQVASETLKVVERFRRVDENNIDYTWTVHDPVTYTRTWSGTLPMRAEKGPMLEYACHEGNYALRNVLSGFRAQERKALEQKK